ncbi:MAG TPA: LysR family transcriptional regulator [Candidatus Binatia bacterium]
MDLDAIAVFVKVVQAGSFSEAAKILKMPNSTVSAKVAALEKSLGVTLLQRTTRRLHLTEAGEGYFRRCLRALEELEAAQNELENEKGEPKGLLRITAPAELGRGALPPLLDLLMKRHPGIDIDLVITSRVADLVAENIDIAVRAGPLKDSGLIARRFVLGQFGLWASPGYLKKHSIPKSPDDLSRHDFLRFAPFTGRKLQLSNGREQAILTLPGRITADDFETLRSLAVLGWGIALLPSFLCAEEAKERRLVSVLPDWRGESVTISIVYPAQRFVAPKIRAFITAAEELWNAKNGEAKMANHL